MLDLSILIVNWNRSDLVATCLQSIRRSAMLGLNYDIILIDNGSELRDIQSLRANAQRERVVLIENQVNAGFTRANNQGLQAAKGRYVLLLNNDTEILDDALATMVRYLDENPDTGIVGARLLNPDGTLQTCYGQFPLPVGRLFIERLAGRLRPRAPGACSGDANQPTPASPSSIETDWVLGAALMIRRSLVEQIGLLDERLFMYAQEIDLCYRAKQAGWKVAVVPGAQIVHLEGGSTQKRPDMQSRLRQERDRNLEWFYRKHYGRCDALAVKFIHFRKRLAWKLRSRKAR